MPYQVVKRGSKWHVINKRTKRVLGRHKSKAAASKQLRAVYANTKGK